MAIAKKITNTKMMIIVLLISGAGLLPANIRRKRQLSGSLVQNSHQAAVSTDPEECLQTGGVIKERFLERF